MTAAAALSALLQKATITDHEELLKECNAALKQAKADPEILHIKIIALLKLDRHEDALKIFEEHPDRLNERAAFERAYALYKVGKLDEARRIGNEDSSNRGLRHVQAQASYRAEDFVKASALYQALIDDTDSHDDNESDLRINSSATDAQIAWTSQSHAGERKKPSREDLELFETAYNAACGSIARGDLGQGAVLLKRAQDVCQASEELSAEEKAVEILPIQLQQLYVLNRLGKKDEADELATRLSKQQTSDTSTAQILQNNVLAALKDGTNPYLHRRDLNDSTQSPQSDKLFSYQTDLQRQNSLVLDLDTHKQSAIIKSTDSVITSEQPSISNHVNTLSVLNAAARIQGSLSQQGLKQLLPLFESRPADVGLALTIIQLYLLTGNVGAGINVLEKLLSHLKAASDPAYQDVLYAPGLVALQTSLYSSQNRKSQVRQSLRDAVLYWCKKSRPPTTLLEAAGAALLDADNEDDRKLVRKIYSILRTADPKSKIAAAGFVASHASDPSTTITEKDISLLPTLQDQIRGIDVEALAAAGVASLPNNETLSTRKRTLDDKPKPSKKRHRQSRLPKDHDPSKTPDPERWLPLKDRSSYRPPKRKGKKRDADRDRTQGGPVNEKPLEKGAEVAKAAEKPLGGVAKSKGKKKGRK